MKLEEAAGPGSPHLSPARVVTDGTVVLAAHLDREPLLGDLPDLHVLAGRIGVERHDARQEVADLRVLPAVVFGIVLGPLKADLIRSPVVFLLLRDGRVLVDRRRANLALRGPGRRPPQHLTGFKRVVRLLAVAQQRLEDSPLAEFVRPGQRLVLLRDGRLGRDQGLDRFVARLREIEFIRQLEAGEAFGDLVFELRRPDRHRLERIVGAAGLFRAGVVPHAADELPVLGPVRFSRHRQRIVKRTVGEVDQDQPAAVVDEIDEGRFRSRAQRRVVVPVDVVLDDDIVRPLAIRTRRQLRGQFFNVVRNIDRDPRIDFKQLLDDRRRLLPVVPLVCIIAGEHQHTNGCVGFRCFPVSFLRHKPYVADAASVGRPERCAPRTWQILPARLLLGRRDVTGGVLRGRGRVKRLPNRPHDGRPRQKGTVDPAPGHIRMRRPDERV